MLKQVVIRMFSCCVLVLAGAVFASDVTATQNEQPQLEKQPVFLFCPHKESAGAWSLYVVVDKNHPTKALALGLEELQGKNSKDNTYNGVLSAQKNPNTQRSELAKLDASQFGSSKLEGRDGLLSIGVTPEKDGLHLELNAKISADQHFLVGGSAKQQRDLILSYSYVRKAWVAKSPNLEDNTGRNAAAKYALPLTGIVFTASALGVSRIAAVDDLGAAIMLMDR